ncbi:GAG-pre-integrase domain-containing protein [Proteus mirabilis]|nr:GAG-pre-integrase domain-containing protein [Proteus mirabilis]
MVIHTNENGLLDLDRSDTHIHNIEAKRCKVNNDSATYLWHCRLGHIGVKRMKKLHADGLLESLDYESVDACEPCFMGKMTKSLFGTALLLKFQLRSGNHKPNGVAPRDAAPQKT